MHRLTLSQKGLLMKLWNKPSYQAPVNECRQVSALSLAHHGYIETVRIGDQLMYGLAFPGIRYCQTGKQIGE